MDFYVIGDQDTVLGFRYAGIPGTTVETADEAAGALADVTGSGKASIIIMTEHIASSIRARVNELRFGAALPLVVEIPGPEGPVEGRPTLLQLIREAVGVKF